MFDALTSAANNLNTIEPTLLKGLFLMAVAGMVAALALGMLLGFLWAWAAAR